MVKVKIVHDEEGLIKKRTDMTLSTYIIKVVTIQVGAH